MKNLVRILSSMPIKLGVVYKWKLMYQIQNPEKEIKELKKPNLACVSLSRFKHLYTIRLVEFLHFKFIIRMKNKERLKVLGGR